MRGPPSATRRTFNSSILCSLREPPVSQSKPRLMKEETYRLSVINLCATARVIVFRSFGLRSQLQNEAVEYCNKNIGLDKVKKVITLPRALLWSQLDFGKTEKDILVYIVENLRDTEVAQFLESLKQKSPTAMFKGVTIKYSDYIWDFRVILQKPPKNPNDSDED